MFTRLKPGLAGVPEDGFFFSGESDNFNHKTI